MRARFFLLGTTCLALSVTLGGVMAQGCSTSVETTPPGAGGGGSGGGFGGSSTSTEGFGGSFDGGFDALPDYVDPGCPDAGPAPTMFACDPYHQYNGQCAPGEGCYIFVQYPDQPCGQETYGSNCSPVGMGTQSAPCNGSQDCGAGFECVVSGSGNQCVLLCPLMGADGCPDGLVCEPIDVEGFGGCL